MAIYKLLLFTDYHISSKGRRSMRRLDECVKTSEWLAGLIKEHWPDFVGNLGDTFDSHSSLDVPTLCTGVRAMDTILAACKSVAARYVILPGNHDAYSSAYSSLEALSQKGVDIVWEPTVFDDLVGCMPYSKNFELATKQLKDLEKKSKVCLVHLDVMHAKYYTARGVDSNIGVEPNDFDGPIFGGHYHHPHTVGAFEFIGSVMHHNNTDKEFLNAPRGAVVVVIEDGEIQRVDRFANPHTPIYHTVDWTKRFKFEDVFKFSKYAGRMHLRVKCKPENVKKYREEVESSVSNLLSLSIVGVNKEKEAVTREVSVSVDTSPNEAIKAFMKNKGTPKTLDKSKLLKMGQEIIKSASMQGDN
jgi:DNA repair exonuclease SbcCD nuclease subunit